MRQCYFMACERTLVSEAPNKSIFELSHSPKHVPRKRPLESGSHIGHFLSEVAKGKVNKQRTYVLQTAEGGAPWERRIHAHKMKQISDLFRAIAEKRSTSVLLTPATSSSLML